MRLLWGWPVRLLALGWVVGFAWAGCRTPPPEPQGPTADHRDWYASGGDLAHTRYSSLDQIGPENVEELQVLWRRSAADPRWRAEFPSLGSPSYLRSIPIMARGTLYAQNNLGFVEAFHPGTGETLWRQDPVEISQEELSAQSTRGVAFWHGGGEGAGRILAVRGEYLYALHAETGERIAEFGDEGRVLLRNPGEDAFPFRWTSAPLLVHDVVVIGGMRGGAGDFAPIKEREPEDITAYDVRTGDFLWRFHVVPREGEYGADTWGDESWRFSGDLGAWCCMSADPGLGLVYLPLSAPTAAYYGGHRPGENLFSNALVALDYRTGERAWYFQTVRHDLWEYDLPAPPILGQIQVDGVPIPAVIQASKTGFLYTFHRETGEPVWPIEDRPVPESTVPGEEAWPTQPFPTRPPAFDRQNITEDELIDFTPEIRERALEAVAPYRLAPIFTPPSLIRPGEEGGEGTLVAPGLWGAGNWNTGAFDPETGVYYAISHTLPSVYGLTEPEDPEATMDYTLPVVSPPDVDGLPVVKPPWGRITAIDMNRGEHLWMVPNGEGPRDHPLLEGLDLPRLGIPGRPAPLLTRTLLFLGEGSDAMPGVGDGMWGTMFRAYDKATGEVVWEHDLGTGTTSAPMTYMDQDRQVVLIPTGAQGTEPEWVALSLP